MLPNSKQERERCNEAVDFFPIVFEDEEASV